MDRQCICILSGLEIPRGKKNLEHLVPRSRAPRYITNNPLNHFPAHKVINCIKGNLLPCEFEEEKFELSYHAIHNWHIRSDDREFVRHAIQNWENNYHPDWCKLCLLKCKEHSR